MSSRDLRITISDNVGTISSILCLGVCGLLRLRRDLLFLGLHELLLVVLAILLAHLAKEGFWVEINFTVAHELL